MYTYDIKIRGNGTAKEIAESLEGIIESLKDYKDDAHEAATLDGAEWEDQILYTEINQK